MDLSGRFSFEYPDCQIKAYNSFENIKSELIYFNYFVVGSFESLLSKPQLFNKESLSIETYKLPKSLSKNHHHFPHRLLLRFVAAVSSS